MNDKLNFTHKCDFCEKTFFDEQLLSLHIKSDHYSIIMGQKRPFNDQREGEVFEQIFQNEKILRNHVKLHPQEIDNNDHSLMKNYKCRICNKGFTNMIMILKYCKIKKMNIDMNVKLITKQYLENLVFMRVRN